MSLPTKMATAATIKIAITYSIKLISFFLAIPNPPMILKEIILVGILSKLNTTWENVRVV